MLKLFIGWCLGKKKNRTKNPSKTCTKVQGFHVQNGWWLAIRQNLQRPGEGPQHRMAGLALVFLKLSPTSPFLPPKRMLFLYGWFCLFNLFLFVYLIVWLVCCFFCFWKFLDPKGLFYSKKWITMRSTDPPRNCDAGPRLGLLVSSWDLPEFRVLKTINGMFSHILW